MRIDKSLRLPLSVAIIFILTLCFQADVHAGYTKVGIAASQSYVNKNDNRPVIIFVGDSRAMMCTYPKNQSGIRSNFCFCWVNGGNVRVLQNQLKPYVENMIRRYRGRCVVAFNLGVNGNSKPKGNARRMIRIYRQWMKRYQDVKFYVVSVNPTLSKAGPYANSKVIALNRYLKKEFEPEGLYIDTCTPITESGLVTGKAKGMRDDYHYKWSVSRRCLSVVRKFVSDAG